MNDTKAMEMQRFSKIMVAVLFLIPLSTLLMVGCGEVNTAPESPPPLAEGLTGDWKQVSAAFDLRIKAKFPKGSDVDLLKAELTHEGFESGSCNVPVGGPDLGFTACRKVRRPDGCMDDWIVSWSATDNKIAATEAMRWGWCIS